MSTLLQRTGVCGQIVGGSEVVWGWELGGGREIPSSL